MNRRRLLVTLGAAIVASPLASFAQRQAKVARIAVPISGSEESHGHHVEALKRGMHEQGYGDGDVFYDVAFAGGKVERFEEMLAKLASASPSVIVVAGPAMMRAALKATQSTPIVMANVSDAVGNKFVATLARPGGRVTGITTQYEELLPKICQILHEIVPKAARVAVILSETSPSHGVFWDSSKKGLDALGKTAIRLVVDKPGDIEPAFRTLRSLRAQAVLIVADPMYMRYRKEIAAQALSAKLPSAFGIREHAEAGGLFSYGPSFPGNYRRSAWFAAKILKGAKPSELPVEQPTTFEFVVNLRTAQKLGVAVPPELRLRADELIE